MPKQRNEQSSPQPIKPTGDQLDITKAVDPPPITDALEKAKQTLLAASKVKQENKRPHRCRSCHADDCNHFEREYTDTYEPFDAEGPPYVDADAKERR